MLKAGGREGAFFLSDPITGQIVVLLIYVIYLAVRGECQHKQDTDIVVGPELLILSHRQNFVKTEMQWQDCGCIRNSRDYLEPAVHLVLLVLYILTQ